MRLLTLPTFRTRSRHTETEVDITSLYNNIKNRFVYMNQSGYEFGQKGAFSKFSIYHNRSKHKYSFNFNVRIG